MKNTDLEIVTTGKSGLSWIAGLLLWAVSVSAYSAPLEVFWEKSDGDFTSVTLESVAVTPDGGLLLGGSLTSATFENLGGSTSAAYLMKLDSSGKKVWTTDFWRGGVNVLNLPRSSIVALFRVRDGSCFCLERFSGGSIFNPNGADAGEYVIKADSLGKKAWEKRYSDFQADSPRVNAIAPAGDNGCAIAGTSREGAFLTRFDSGGATVWKKVGTEMYVSALNNLAASADGGFFLGSNKSIGSVTTMTLVKVDSLGNVIWDKTFQHGTNMSTVASSLVGTPDGGCLIAGGTRETESAQSAHLFLKLDSAGEKEWEYVWSDPNAPEDVVSMARTRDGDYLCLGTRTIYDSVQKQIIPLSATLARVAAPGKIVWQKNYERPQYLTWASRLFITPDGAYGFLGTRGPTLNEMTPLLVKISSEARAEVWARYGSATIASPAATPLGVGPVYNVPCWIADSLYDRLTWTVPAGTKEVFVQYAIQTQQYIGNVHVHLDSNRETNFAVLTGNTGSSTKTVVWCAISWDFIDTGSSHTLEFDDLFSGASFEIHKLYATGKL